MDVLFPLVRNSVYLHYSIPVSLLHVFSLNVYVLAYVYAKAYADVIVDVIVDVVLDVVVDVVVDEVVNAVVDVDTGTEM